MRPVIRHRVHHACLRHRGIGEVHPGPVLAHVDIVPGDNWYLGIVGGIALAMLLAWPFAVTAFLKRTGFFEETNEARC